MSDAPRYVIFIIDLKTCLCSPHFRQSNQSFQTSKLSVSQDFVSINLAYVIVLYDETGV
jgi:hypothetical protein